MVVLCEKNLLKLTYRQCYCQYDIAIIGLELLSDVKQLRVCIPKFFELESTNFMELLKREFSKLRTRLDYVSKF